MRIPPHLQAIYDRCHEFSLCWATAETPELKDFWWKKLFAASGELETALNAPSDGAALCGEL